jgi:hypothetical protein
MRFVRRALAAPPPIAAAALLVVLQLLAAAALAHGQGWGYSRRDEAIAALLLAVEVTLLYAVALLIGGRIFALGAPLLFIVGPVILAKRYFVVGGPNLDYKTVYRHDVLPTAFGLTARAGIIAACLILAAAWLVLARTRAPLWVTAGLGGVAAAAAALVGRWYCRGRGRSRPCRARGLPARSAHPARLAPNGRDVGQRPRVLMEQTHPRVLAARRLRRACATIRSSGSILRSRPAGSRDLSARASDRPDDVPARDRAGASRLLAARGEHPVSRSARSAWCKHELDPARA